MKIAFYNPRKNARYDCIVSLLIKKSKTMYKKILGLYIRRYVKVLRIKMIDDVEPNLNETLLLSFRILHPWL